MSTLAKVMTIAFSLYFGMPTHSSASRAPRLRA